MKKIILLSTTAMFLVGCSVTPQPLSQVDMSAGNDRDMAIMFSSSQELVGSLDLSTAVERAVFNNLASRLRTLESGYAMTQMRVDSLDMLPTLAANAGYTNRGTDGYSTSQIFGQTAATGTYSRGSDPINTTSDLTVTWNILDFALGYYNAKQSADRALIAQERERQATHDLIRNAKAAYWRAYAADRMHAQIARASRDAENALVKISEGEQNGSIPPAAALGQRRTVLESLRQLEVLSQEMNVARIELAQMINVAPGTNLTFANEQMRVPQVPGTLEDLEKLAFENNPELREQMYRERISASDVKRTAASMFPNLSLSVGHNENPDSFVLDHSWNQVGLNASFNLMRLMTGPTRMRQSHEGQDVEAARSLVVRMAVLAQTNIAYEQYQFGRRQYARARDLYEIDAALAQQTSARREASVASDVEAVVADTAAILSRLRLFQAYATLVGASEGVLASVGDDTEIMALNGRLNSIRTSAESDQATAETALAALAESQASLEAQIRALNNQITSAQRELDRANSSVERANARLQKAIADVEDGGEATERQASKIAVATAKVEEANSVKQAAEAALNQLNIQIADLQSQQLTNVDAQKTAEAELNAAEQTLEFYSNL